MKDVMVDLETLGTVADAVILSIGAVKFNLNSDEVDDDGFYASISVDSNLESKRRIQEDTLIWWMKQPTAAQQVFFEKKQSLGSALAELSDWIGSGQYQIWSNGADFDIPMLAHAFSSLQIDIPWKFWDARCFRTYKNLPGAKDAPKVQEGIKHNAMADAYNQARTLQAIQSTLFGPKKVKT